METLDYLSNTMRTKPIIGLACIVATYFTAHYASTVAFGGMIIWGLAITTMLFIAGLILIMSGFE
jgi:predicted phage tail protein